MKTPLRRLAFPAACALVVAWYATAEVRGWGGTPAKDGIRVPADARNDPNYYRRSLYTRGGK